MKTPDVVISALEGYIYDEQTGRYINKITGVWYVVKDGYKVIPPEEYIDRAKVETIDGINITDRPNDVWELKEIREITVKSGDTLVDIINPYFMNKHFRMNYEWYAKQVLKLNNLTDPHIVTWRNCLTGYKGCRISGSRQGDTVSKSTSNHPSVMYWMEPNGSLMSHLIMV